MAKWSPVKVILKHARALQRRAAAAVRSASPKVAHRDGQAGGGPTGGSLASAISGGKFTSSRRVGKKGAQRSVKVAHEFLEIKPWGVVLQWHALGQKFLWFVEGTSRQKARPVPLMPDQAALTRDLQADAQRHYERLAARGRRRWASTVA